jgi:regulatory protein YycI of two-component signal transduction system YycFG
MRWEAKLLDWNKTKSIFIIVFAILNLFLYSMYVDRSSEAEKFSVLGEGPIEQKLEDDDITYSDLPENDRQEPYVHGTIKEFEAEEIPGENLQVNILDGEFLNVVFNDPVAMPLTEEGDIDLEAFAADHILNGDQYVLWKVDPGNGRAVFFQEVNERPLYYSENAKLTVYWNDLQEVTRYEQSMFDEIVPQELDQDMIPALQAIHTLYQRTVLQPGTHIETAELGYSVFVQISEGRKMFLPTWRIVASLDDGTTEEYFVNAVKDGVIELKQEQPEDAE